VCPNIFGYILIHASPFDLQLVSINYIYDPKILGLLEYTTNIILLVKIVVHFSTDENGLVLSQVKMKGKLNYPTT
jgi:hypothetical protein